MTDWEARYVAGDTPWDMGAPISVLTDALADGLLGRPGTAFVPGAGRGHDAAALASAGWATTVVDISPSAVSYAAEHYRDVRFVLGDALDPVFVLEQTGGPVDLLWDHTFFCALPPELRPLLGEVAAALVRPGGILASGAFPIDRPRGEAGPPWPYPPEDMDAVLEAALPGGFERVHTGQPVHLTDAVFPWLHQLVIWRRRQAGR